MGFLNLNPFQKTEETKKAPQHKKRNRKKTFNNHWISKWWTKDKPQMNSLKISNGLVNVSSRKKVAVDVWTRTKKWMCVHAMYGWVYACHIQWK